MADTLESRVATMKKQGLTAIQIHERFRNQGLTIPWIAVLKAFQEVK
jgi:hypothetical protein